MPTKRERRRRSVPVLTLRKGCACWDTVVVGGGPAGLTAAFYLARAGFKTLVLERGRVGGQAARIPLIQNYPGFPKGIAGSLLAGRLNRQARRWGARILAGDVRKALPAARGWQVRTADSKTYRCRAVLLATGSEFLPLGVPGESALRERGVHHAVFDTAKRFTGQRVGVVGGGETAAHQALALAEHAENVTLFLRDISPRAIGPLRKGVDRNARIKVIANAQVRRVVGKRSLTGVEWTHTNDGKRCRRVAMDALFVLVGKKPRLPNVRFGGPNAGVDSLFVAGDAREGNPRQVVSAAADGLARAMECERYLMGWA